MGINFGDGTRREIKYEASWGWEETGMLHISNLYLELEDTA